MNWRAKMMRGKGAGSSGWKRGFTLVELMIVVAIMGLILAVGAPTLYKFFRKEGFRKSVSDMMEACSTARSRAIMSQTQTELVFHPREKTCEVSGGGSGGWSGMAASAKFEGGVQIDGLFVNLMEYTQEEVARVRFFPNGTCDEMLLIISSDQNKQCGFNLEITTGLVSFLNETELQKLRSRGL